MSNEGFLLNTTQVSLAGAMTVGRSVSTGICSIGTMMHGDTLYLDASNVAFANFSNVGGATFTSRLSNAGDVSIGGNVTVLDNVTVFNSETINSNLAVGGFLNVGSDIVTQGALSSAAGIVSMGKKGTAVCGISVGDSKNSSNSFLWHAGSNLSHWELVGGDLKVTRIRAGSRSVSYTLRISDDDAFEIHQSTSNQVGPSSHRRVARFGGPTVTG